MGMCCNPLPPVITDLAALRKKKTEEIRRVALRIGQDGININTGVNVYHMAITPEDVSLLQQTNMVAKMTWEAMGLEAGSPYRLAELKEKWIENGEEKTRLHPDVEEQEHNAVLFYAVLQAREILLKQESLIQLVQDATTPEEINQITWR